MSGLTRRRLLGLAAVGAAAAPLSGCVMEGEGPGRGMAAGSDTEIYLDYATYNPLSLIIREKGWLETVAAEDGQEVHWTFSAGSNKANEFLRGGAIDIGSTAGSAALLARTNRSPIRAIDICSQPEWAALVRTADSPLRSVEDLRGRSVAATKGTDPYFFLLQALSAADMGFDETTVVNLQHADGRSALTSGQVDAWSGLDPIMAGAEQDGAVLFQRDLAFNTYCFLNARELFLEINPRGAQMVVDVYAHARSWALENPQEGIAILARESDIDRGTAARVWERTHLDIDPVPGDDQLEVLERIAPILVETGDVPDLETVQKAIDTILDARFGQEASAQRAAEIIEGHSA